LEKRAGGRAGGSDDASEDDAKADHDEVAEMMTGRDSLC
jgi:hypothetical protein